MSLVECKYILYNDNEYQHHMMGEREKDIVQISSDINKVHAIYSDLGNMVNDQQEQVDDIENQINNAADNTDKGVNQLTKAAKNQRTRSTCCFYILITGVILLVIVIISVIVLNHIH